jgi:hypothetical protein
VGNPDDDLDEIKRCIVPRLERRYPLIAPAEIARLVDEEAAALDLDEPRLTTREWPAGPIECRHLDRP